MRMNAEKITKVVLFLAASIIVVLAGGMAYLLFGHATEAFSVFGFKFIFSTEWNPTEGKEAYGALPFIVGTLVTSVLALIICFPFAFSTTLFLGEYFKGKKIAGVLGTLVDLLAGIPSIVYGLWGFYVLKPLLVEYGINEHGLGVFTASLILAVMIIPYATTLSNEVVSMVPNELKEAAYSLGATRREVITNVILPTASSGIVASYVLSLGRALGETMAVTMLIGNANVIPDGLFGTGNTMASVIANQFGEAEGLKLSSLIAIGLLLFLITALINFLGKFIMKRLY